jgi:hypothetical protein
MDYVNHLNIQNLDAGHVFYRFQNGESYLNRLISFVKTGLERKQHILIIESMRNLPTITAELNSLFTAEQQSTIRFVNNYDYYLSNGDFNTQTILTHFGKDLSILNSLNTSIRTWAHVEWVSTEPEAQLLMDFESQADDFVLQEKMVSVCAYSVKSLSSSLNDALEQVNKYVMTDDDFSLSSLYEE